MIIIPDRADGNGVALQIQDRLDALISEQFVTAGMDTGNQYHGLARIDLEDQAWNSLHRKIRPARREEAARLATEVIDVFHLGKSLQVQQLFRHGLRRQTDRLRLNDTNFRGLRRRLRRSRTRKPEQCCSAEHRGARQELSAADPV